MKVILLEEDVKLGDRGDIVDVKNGYARNFLVPQQKALLATKGNVSMIQNNLKMQAKKIEKEKSEQQKVADKLKEVVLEFKAKAGVTGQLFGTITTDMIVAQIKEKSDIEVSKKKVALNTHIKTAGIYSAKVKLYSGVDVAVTVKVDIEKDPKEVAKAKALEKEMEKIKKARELEEIEAKSAEEVEIADADLGSNETTAVEAIAEEEETEA